LCSSPRGASRPFPYVSIIIENGERGKIYGKIKKNISQKMGGVRQRLCSLFDYNFYICYIKSISSCFKEDFAYKKHIYLLSKKG